MRHDRSEYNAHRGLAQQTPYTYMGPERRKNRDGLLTMRVLRSLWSIFRG